MSEQKMRGLRDQLVADRDRPEGRWGIHGHSSVDDDYFLALDYVIARMDEALAAPAGDRAGRGEPVGYFRCLGEYGWEQCSENDDGAVALYGRPHHTVEPNKMVVPEGMTEYEMIIAKQLTDDAFASGLAERFVSALRDAFAAAPEPKC